MASHIDTEIVYATDQRQELISLRLLPGTTVGSAIEQSSLQQLFPDDELKTCVTGIWGRIVSRSEVLQEGDRIELYRDLTQNPRDARRERVISAPTANT